MTDKALVIKKLAFMETCLHEIRTLTQINKLKTDVKERRFVEHSLQLIIQAFLDIASHIVSDNRLGEPETNYDLLELLKKDSWISEDNLTVLQDIVGFRNILYYRLTPSTSH